MCSRQSYWLVLWWLLIRLYSKKMETEVVGFGFLPITEPITNKKTHGHQVGASRRVRGFLLRVVV